jgi:hypothetical protein
MNEYWENDVSELQIFVVDRTKIINLMYYHIQLHEDKINN